MFDYNPDVHDRTLYHPAPGWPTIAGTDDTADLAEYLNLQEHLLKQGEPHSRRGAAAHGVTVIPQLVPKPAPINRADIVAVVQRVMSTVHPLAVTQEQILRAAFFTQLSDELAIRIGTGMSAVHPERPTPSDDYVFTAKRGTGMRARYDLGFGHPTDTAGIIGVMELKAGLATFDRLDNLGRLTVDVDDTSEKGENGLAIEAQPKKREEPLPTDLYKLLDPKLPQNSCRISWVALGKRGSATVREICEQAVRIVRGVAEARQLSGQTYAVDSSTGWLVFNWAHPQPATLELAWYHPKADTPFIYEPVFGAGLVSN
jgi:hypothetical protein